MLQLTKWRNAIKSGFSTWPIMLIALAISACKDDPKVTILEVQVNNSGVGQDAINVTLYSSQEDWLAGTNSIASAMTDADGQVVFDESLQAVSYYVDVFDGTTTNWDGEIITPVLTENDRTEFTVEVSDSRTNFLVGKQEKSWVIADAEIDGFSVFVDLDACEKDDVLFFQRDENAGLEDLGDQLCEGEVSDQILFEWSFNSDETELTINDVAGGSETFEINAITESRMEVIVPLDLEGVPTDILFIFEPL